jgi:hypothetical protein
VTRESETLKELTIYPFSTGHAVDITSAFADFGAPAVAATASPPEYRQGL